MGHKRASGDHSASGDRAGTSLDISVLVNLLI